MPNDKCQMPNDNGKRQRQQILTQRTQRKAEMGGNGKAETGNRKETANEEKGTWYLFPENVTLFSTAVPRPA